MLMALRNAKLITGTKVREIDWLSEVEHRCEFARFLREIPQDFRIIARHREKKQMVKVHLRAFYKRDPKDHEVDTVLERITNLASVVEGGRDSVENKAQQYKFKSEQWQKRERCEICGYKFLELQDVTLDHIVPLALGGSEKEANWQLTCSLCNNQKQEYWGISDLSRSVSFRSCQGDLGNFFNLAMAQVIGQLGLKGNPTRYWVLERDNRMCSECKAPASATKLLVALREQGFLLTIDNLSTYCLDCVKKTPKIYHE